MNLLIIPLLVCYEIGIPIISVAMVVLIALRLHRGARGFSFAAAAFIIGTALAAFVDAASNIILLRISALLFSRPYLSALALGWELLRQAVSFAIWPAMFGLLDQPTDAPGHFAAPYHLALWAVNGCYYLLVAWIAAFVMKARRSHTKG